MGIDTTHNIAPITAAALTLARQQPLQASHPESIMAEAAFKRFPSLILVIAVLASTAALFANESVGLRLVAKPTDNAVARQVEPQPTVPAEAKEELFVETAAEPVATAAETQRGYILFQRPITEAIYANTRPLAHERIESLVAFAASGQFQPITFALYPLRPLRNLKVRVSALACAADEIPATCVDMRLVTYWNIAYPAFDTVGTYRRVPELLERVTVHSAPEKECQRYWLTIAVPTQAKPGLYQGTVTIWDDGFEQALAIPLALRVVDFRLQNDPGKHFSAYYYVRDPFAYKGKDEAFLRKLRDNEYQAMADFGLDMMPTLNFEYENGKLVVLHSEEMARMAAVGLKGLVPIIGDDAIGAIYQEATPQGKRKGDWVLDPPPGPAFYAKVTKLFGDFEKERQANGWPPFICNPADEIAVSAQEFGGKLYAAVHAAGIRTYATKDPCAADADAYAPYLDIWCSQPYSVAYDKIVTQNSYEYWCYPNHNACEIRDPQTMCKGGRMTYGFGFWRSGYTTLIPWHWSWTPGPDPLDYLRGRYCGCGQRFTPDAEVIPAVYWACFRAGRDDQRYLYTLQQAIVERENSADPACQAAVQQGHKLLQEIWDAILVQPKYLAAGMWPSEEFDARRWQLAQQISRLMAFPASRQAVAPSVMVAATAAVAPPPPAPSPLERVAQSPMSATLDLLDGGVWQNGTPEGKLEPAQTAGYQGKTGLHWLVAMDQHEGGEGGHPADMWPRMARDFQPGQLDLTQFDLLQVRLRSTSNRPPGTAAHTPISLNIALHDVNKPLYEAHVDAGGDQRNWVTLQWSIADMMAQAGGNRERWKSVGSVMLFLSDLDFKLGTHLTMDVGEISLLRLRTPVIESATGLGLVLLPSEPLAFELRILGTAGVIQGSYTVNAALEDAKGTIHAQAQRDWTDARWMILPMAEVESGTYSLRFVVRDAKGASCSEWTQPLTAFAGPLMDWKPSARGW